MDVCGYVLYFFLHVSWFLSRSVKHINSLEDIYKECDFITIHVPLMDATKKMINKEAIQLMKKDVILLNFARDALVDEQAVLDGIAAGKIRKYVSDFANPTTAGQEGVILIPHLGASTAEAEDNCAKMAVQEIADFMENGNISHSVNYPDCQVGVCRTAGRITLMHRNNKGVIAQYTTILGDANINISDMFNKTRGDFAYAVLDIDAPVTDEVVERLNAIEDVIRVRVVK